MTTILEEYDVLLWGREKEYAVSRSDPDSVIEMINGKWSKVGSLQDVRFAACKVLDEERWGTLREVVDEVKR
jgi:hypothetical protein